MKIQLVTIAMICITFSSCTKKILFTQQYRARISQTDNKNVEKLQYYNDREIELVYRSATRDASFKGGKVRFEDGFYVYTIEFKKKTPAIATNMDSRALKVYFEPEKYLVFRNFDGDDVYSLGGQIVSGEFHVHYEGRLFRTEKGGSAKLLFKKNNKVFYDEDRRRAKGIKMK